jgi:hypothetical protein
MIENSSFGKYEVVAGKENSVGNFFVQFHEVWNPLHSQKQTVIEVRWNFEKLPPLHSSLSDDTFQNDLEEDDMEDPMIDQQKSKKFTSDHVFSIEEQKRFLDSLENVHDIHSVFSSLVKK